MKVGNLITLGHYMELLLTLYVTLQWIKQMDKSQAIQLSMVLDYITDNGVK